MISIARIAEGSSRHMETTAGNIAATLAISPTEKDVLAVKNEYRANLEHYLAAMLQAKKMLKRGILTPVDFARVDAIMARKYGIPENSLYRG